MANRKGKPPVLDAREAMFQVRRDRMRQLIDLEMDGVTCRLIKTGDALENRSRSSFISQLLSGHRNFTERTARSLEVECGKPPRWLDGLRDTEMNARIRASDERIRRFKQLVDTTYHGGIGLMLQENKVGERHGSWIVGLFDGSRYLSESAGRLLAKACGFRAEVLEKAPPAKARNEPVEAC